MQERIKLFPKRFPTGVYSGSPRDFEWYETLKTKPRGGEDILEYWYSTDPDESEYLDTGFQAHCDELLERLKREGWDPRTKHAWCIGQSHLDLGWMWHLRQGVAKAETTFGKVHGHFTLFDPLTFTGSQPAQYQWVKQHDPDTWTKVVHDVVTRRHEVQGGCWSEADGRIPGGEAWVRQRLYGQLFYARNFGRLATIAWFPDSFGFANNLPQIFVKSGSTAFFTTKLTSNKQTRWPFWAWRWQAPDGSSLVSFMSGSHNKIGPFGGFDVPQLDSDVRETYAGTYRLLEPGRSLVADYEMDKPEEREELSDEELPLLGVFFGEGDGGHGPQGVEVATCRAMAERGVASWCNAREFYDKIEPWVDRLPAWNDELYYQFHRGSLTTQTVMKRMNRFFERTLPVVEALHLMISILAPGSPLPPFERFYTGEHDMTPATSNPVEQIWQNVLLMQFHDVLPGTSIPEVYDECHEFWVQDKPLLASMERTCLDVLARHHGLDREAARARVSVDGHGTAVLMPVLVSNPSPGAGRQLAEIPVDALPGKAPFALLAPGAGARPVPVQLVDAETHGDPLDRKGRRWIAVLDVAPWTTSTCWLACIDGEPGDMNEWNENATSMFTSLVPGTRPGPAIETRDGKIVVATGECTIAVDTTTGALVSLATAGTEHLSGPSRIRAYADNPHREPCWNLQVGWWEHELDIVRCTGVELVERGPVRWTVRSTLAIGKGSTGNIDHAVVPGMDGVFTFTGLDFHETETLVKHHVPLADPGTWSFAETCYAVSKRRNKPIANHDVPRWEKWMNGFVAMERDDSTGGLAVINDGKHGFDTLDESIATSIVHGPKYPGTNVVAWAGEERERRAKAGLGEPPSHADQGEHGTRLRLLPYSGSWRDGRVHRESHAFNAPARLHVVAGAGGPLVDVGSAGKALDRVIRDAGLPATWFTIDDPRVEVPVLKPGETLPAFMDAMHGTTRGTVFRVVNNVDVEVHATIDISPVLVPGGSTMIETNLLEQPLPAREHPGWSLQHAGDAGSSLSTTLAPHEIRTFKILPTST